MRPIDADALSAFVGDLRSTLHKEQSTFKAMTEIEFNTRDYMLLNFQYTIDNAPTVEQSYQEPKDYIKNKLDYVRPHSNWIYDYTNGFGNKVGHCSKCMYRCEHYNFCPNCGADMRGEENEEVH